MMVNVNQSPDFRQPPPTPIYYRNLLDLRLVEVGSRTLPNKILNLNNLYMSLSRRRVVIYYLGTSFDRVMARSNETFIRAILE